MRRVLLLTVALLWLGMLSLADTAKPNQEEAAIHAVVEKAESAWNAGDPAAFANSWAEDGDFVTITGILVKGRPALQKHFSQLFSGAFKGSHSSLHVNSIRFLKPDVAVLDGHLEITGRHGPDGKELVPIEGLVTQVLAKQSGIWSFVSYREMVPLAAPPQ
jgi:uncharacterized protein (TIGR02246 family)